MNDEILSEIGNKLTAPKVALERLSRGEKVPKEFFALAAKELDAAVTLLPKLKENDTVELVSREGVITGVRKVEVAKEDLFTCVAMVERVIDGDTLLFSFDFGCPMSVSQKLRLRGINCPEIDTEEGKRAKRFVESRLKDCDFIVVKTYKDRADKFDRYLADIFYAPQLPQPREAASTTTASDPALVAKEGTYLNQELLNEHLAVAYE